MSITQNIQTIAKTALLEEKIAKAQAEAEAANSIANPSHPSERGTTVQNGTSTQTFGTANGPPPDGQIAQTLYQNYDSSGGVGAAAQAVNMIINAAVSNLVSNSGSDPLTNSQSFSNQATTSGGLSTNMTSATSETSRVGGSNAVAVGQGAPNDAIATGIGTQSDAAGASPTEQDAAAASYINSTYGQSGYTTAKDIGDGTLQTPTMNIGLNGSTEFSDSNTPSSPEQLKGVVGFDKNGTVSPETGQVFVAVVNLNNDNMYPTPTTKDGINNGQGAQWVDPNTPPQYPNFQSGKFWSTSNPELAVGSTPDLCMDNAIASLHAINPGGIYTSAYWDASTLTASGSNYTAKWYTGPPTNPGPPATATITRDNCPMGISFAAYYGYSVGGQCPTNTPTYPNWPKTGSYILNWVNGRVFNNIYDSDVPLLYKQTSSVVRMAMGDGVNVIDDRYLDIRPGIQGGVLLMTIASDGSTVQAANFYNSQGILMRANISAAEVNYYIPR